MSLIGRVWTDWMRVRDRLAIFMLAASSSLGCGYRPPATADEALSRGERGEALQLSRYATAIERERVERAVIESFDPVVTLEPVPDAELASFVGDDLARSIGTVGIVARLTIARRRDSDFGFSERAKLAFDGPRGGLLVEDVDADTLSAYTHEKLPHATSTTTWEITKLPGAAALFPPLLVIALMPQSHTTTTAPSHDELVRAAPMAMRAAYTLSPTSSTRYVIIHKPEDATLPLDLVVGFAAVADMDEAQAAIRIPLPEGRTLEERLRVARRPRRMLADRSLVIGRFPIVRSVGGA